MVRVVRQNVTKPEESLGPRGWKLRFVDLVAKCGGVSCLELRPCSLLLNTRGS